MQLIPNKFHNKINANYVGCAIAEKQLLSERKLTTVYLY